MHAVARRERHPVGVIAVHERAAAGADMVEHSAAVSPPEARVGGRDAGDGREQDLGIERCANGQGFGTQTVTFGAGEPDEPGDGRYLPAHCQWPFDRGSR